MPNRPSTLTVCIKSDRVLIVRQGVRAGITYSGDVADEMSADAAEMLARDLIEAAAKVRGNG